MPASYLRTNYRKTGGNIDINLLGKNILLASAAGGAGTVEPQGGLLVFSQTLSFGEGSAGIAAGFSNAFGDSTVGTLSLFYGSGNFGEGYLFLPVDFQTLSIGAVAVSDCTAGSGVPFFALVNVATSGSIWRISAMRVSIATSATYACAVAARLLITGFIVSTP